MKSIDLFCQGEGVGEILHIELELDATFAVLKARLTEEHRIPDDALLFIEDEDEDEPIDEIVLVKDRATAKGAESPHPPLPPRQGDCDVQRQGRWSATSHRVPRSRG